MTYIPSSHQVLTSGPCTSLFTKLCFFTPTGLKLSERSDYDQVVGHWSPCQLEYIPHSHLILANDILNKCVKVYTVVGELVYHWGEHEPLNVGPLTMFGHDNRFVYRMTDGIVSILRIDGTLVRKWPSQDKSLFSLAVHPTEDLILLTTRSPDVQIQAYQKDGSFLYSFDLDLPEQFGHLQIRLYAERNLVLVHNRENRLIYVFHLRGDFLFSFALPEQQIPYTMAIDHQRDLIYVHSISGLLFTFSF